MLEEILSVVLLTPMDDPSSPTCRWGAPTLFWGPPGIGKSGRVEAAGAAVGLPVETLYLSTLQPEDLSGIPMPTKKGGEVENVCSLSQVRGLNAAGKGILFLDELTTARPAVQGAGLGVVYNRVVAGKHLPGRVRVVAAANPPEEAAGGWGLAPPMANRLMHLDITAPTGEEWATWLLSADSGRIPQIEEGEQTITDAWARVWPKFQGLGAGFARRNASALYKLPPEGSKDRGKAWPSPRSWEAALRAMATAEALGKQALQLRLLAASCGEAVTREWAEWVAYANLPDPEDALKNTWKPDPRRLDVAFAVYGACTAYALGKKDIERKQYALLAWKLLQGAVDAGLPDVALAPATALVRAGFGSRAGGDIAAAAKSILALFGTAGLADFVQR